MFVIFFFQAEDGIRDLVRSRGLGDVYKRQDAKNAKQRKLLFFASLRAISCLVVSLEIHAGVELSLIHI